MTTTVSSKNQIVIPEILRQETGAKPGMKLYTTVNDAGDIVISTKPIRHQIICALRGVWTNVGDPAQLLRSQRDQK